MTTSFILVYLMIIAAESVVGIVSSAFIVAVNLLDWAKGRRLNVCDHIFVALAFASICYQCAYSAHVYLSKVWMEAGYSEFLTYLLAWTAMSCSWISATLCVFYCVKIVDLNHRLFIWVKLRLHKVLHWMLLFSTVGSLVFTVPLVWNVYTDFSLNSTNILMNSSAGSGLKLKVASPYKFVHSFLGFMVPRLISTASIALILASLYRHTRRMKENAAGFSRPRLEVHLGAARMVGSLLLISFSMLLAECAKQFPLSSAGDVALGFMYAAVVPVKSIIMVLGNTKLKQALQKVVHHQIK